MFAWLDTLHDKARPLSQAYENAVHQAADLLMSNHVLAWMVDHNGIWVFSTIAYVMTMGFMLYLAAIEHATNINARIGHQTYKMKYPASYFKSLIIQLIPITVSGLARNDEFIIATRLGLLGSTLLALGLVRSDKGTFTSRWHIGWATFWLVVVVLGSVLWFKTVHVHNFIATWEKEISYFTVAAMIFFMIFGQGVTAKTLFLHYTTGAYGFKSFGLQVIRFFAFSSQALIYAVVNGAWDVFFISAAIGTIGVSMVLCTSIIGMLIGLPSKLRHRQEAQLRAA